jgi:hypothetical protein
MLSESNFFSAGTARGLFFVSGLSELVPVELISVIFWQDIL